VRLNREGQQLRADHATFLLRDDNTVDRVLADGNVESEVHGRDSSNSGSNSNAHARSDHAELLLTGTPNQLTAAVLSGKVQLSWEGKQPAEAAAGKVTLHFGGRQILETVHAEDGVRLSQKKSQSGAVVTTVAATVAARASTKADSQDIEMTAPVMDFLVKNGRLLERAETSGLPQIVITQPGNNQKTVVTAAKFTAKFTEKNRLATLHGEPEARIVSGKIVGAMSGATAGQAERVSTSQMLDISFRPGGGVDSITQSGNLAYTDGLEKAWAQRGEYTTSDQMLVLSGSPRVVDNGMTTTAQTIRVNRTTGDAIAEGNVKSTYSELKPQPDGGMFASSDPIHVTSRSMTAHRSPAIAVYTGDARLWQNANVVQAPMLQFDRDKRSLVAQGLVSSPGQGAGVQNGAGQPVSTVLVQVDKTGKATPVNITSGRLTYVDAERRILLDGGVTAKGNDATLTGQKMTVFLSAHSQSPGGASAGTASQVERIVADDRIVITEPTRHATGDRLVYTTADEKFVLTGGPPSIFDAERGRITGDSLTFYRHDDRVQVEGKETSPTVTKTQVAR
jgi:lipopolysaccharide export system protein LptA